MKLRQKLIVLAIAPLIRALYAIALFVRVQADALARQQNATISLERELGIEGHAELIRYAVRDEAGGNP